MTVFQIITISTLSLLFLVECWAYLRGLSPRRNFAFRGGLWLAALVAIAWPNLVTRVARSVGIERGADLVSYVIALSFLAVTFYFYSRYCRLQREMTLLVRHLALRDAQRGGTRPPGDSTLS